jgi:hypothetical protein
MLLTIHTAVYHLLPRELGARLAFKTIRPDEVNLQEDTTVSPRVAYRHQSVTGDDGWPEKVASDT